MVVMGLKKFGCLLVLKTSTGIYPFFNHQQTSEVRDITPLYVCFKTSNAINH